MSKFWFIIFSIGCIFAGLFAGWDSLTGFGFLMLIVAIIYAIVKRSDKCQNSKI